MSATLRVTLRPMQTAYIALGSNLASWAGPPEVTMAAALEDLRSLGALQGCSSLYRTIPVGFADQPRFLNAVVAFDTGLTPHALLDGLLRIEQKYGRDRSTGIMNGPRTLDLDILLMDDLQVSEPDLQIPHSRLADRAFVLIPLSEIAPKLRIAGPEKSVSDLLDELQRNCKSESDAVVRIESDTWSRAVLRYDADRAQRERADAHFPDRNRRR
jgi:2-amino-4-hydroxy-6-hydroxymethyldihydropteridine diphosphokinase